MPYNNSISLAENNANGVSLSEALSTGATVASYFIAGWINLAEYNSAGISLIDIVDSNSFSIQSILTEYGLGGVYSSYYLAYTNNGQIPTVVGMASLKTVNSTVNDYKSNSFKVSYLFPFFTLEEIYGSYSLTEIVESTCTTNAAMITAFLAFTSPVSIADMFDAGLTNVQNYNSALVSPRALLTSTKFLLSEVYPIYSLVTIVDSEYKSEADMITEFLALSGQQEVTVTMLFIAGLTNVQYFFDAQVPVIALLNSTKFSVLTVYSIYPLTDIVASGFNTVTIIQQLKGFVALSEMREKGLTNPLDFLAAGVSNSELSTEFPIDNVLSSISSAWADTTDGKKTLSGAIYSGVYTTAELLTSVELNKIVQTVYTERQMNGIPSVVSVHAILQVSPGMLASVLRSAGFTAIQVYGNYTNAELDNAGYTEIPKIAASSLGKSLSI
jgi:hypothetical protein